MSVVMVTTDSLLFSKYVVEWNFKVSKCFDIFCTQVLDEIENYEFLRNSKCLLSASRNSVLSK